MLRLLALAAAVAPVVTPAVALEVTRTINIPAPPGTVWAAIGGFCGIHDWHPVVEGCALSEQRGKPVRTLTLKGGATLVEEETARSDGGMTYSYRILQGPLPVDDYASTIAVAKSGGGATVTWTGTFKAKGVPDAKAEAVIGGVYDAGLDGIADKIKID